ncbi:MAG: hypothetical protein WA057_01000 [Candidatus Magasanikiibacteriota bacterium]
MRISLKQFKKLIVETKLGIKLGFVKDMVLDTEGQNILQYEVGSLVGKKHLVSREQVLNIDSEKMVVEDSVLKINNDEKVDVEIKNVDPSVAMRENSN